MSKYFEGETREALKRFIRQFCECEISIELIRQKILNKLAIRPDAAFNAIDSQGKGYLTLDDVRDFLRSQNIYPSEKNLGLLYDRLDRNEDQAVDFDEFVQAITPFLTGVQKN